MLATILVVGGEFALLTVLYQRGDPIRDQRHVVASLAGEWRAASVPAPVLVLEDTDAAIAELRHLHLDRAELAGLSAGVYPEPSKFADNWRLEHRFKPNMSQATRERKLKGWARAVKGLLASDEGEG